MRQKRLFGAGVIKSLNFSATIFEQLFIVNEIFIVVCKQVNNKIRFVLLENNYWYLEGSVGQGEDRETAVFQQDHLDQDGYLGIRVEEIEDTLEGRLVELCWSKEKRHKMTLRFPIE